MTSTKQRAAEIDFKPTENKLRGQKADILIYIYTHGSITPAEAWDKLHCTKLATRIGEIERRCGVELKHEKESNGSSSYMRYSFKEGYGVMDYMSAQ